MTLFRRKRHERRADLDTARRAREKAERELAELDQDLDQTRARTPLYRALSESLRELERENHIAMQLRVIFQGGPQHGNR